MPLPKNAERFRETKYDELKIKVISGFCGYSGAKPYIERIMEKYPRYIRGQLSIIRRSQEKYTLTELIKAINYCTQRELFSATDFRDTLAYFSKEDDTRQKGSLPEKYSVVKAQTREVSVYTNACQGGIPL